MLTIHDIIVSGFTECEDFNLFKKRKVQNSLFISYNWKAKDTNCVIEINSTQQNNRGTQANIKLQ